MTLLSVNVNKIALLRNSRGRDFPNLCEFVGKLVNLNVKGITVHPRPDERHVTRQDVLDLTEFLGLYPDVEFNIEGYPSKQFMELVLAVQPAQCTLVPDKPGQLTSDHGWDVFGNQGLLTRSLADLRSAGIRSSIFLDPDPEKLAGQSRWVLTGLNSTLKGSRITSVLNPSMGFLRLTGQPLSALRRWGLV